MTQESRSKLFQDHAYDGLCELSKILVPLASPWLDAVRALPDYIDMTELVNKAAMTHRDGTKDVRVAITTYDFSSYGIIKLFHELAAEGAVWQTESLAALQRAMDAAADACREYELSDKALEHITLDTFTVPDGDLTFSARLNSAEYTTHGRVGLAVKPETRDDRGILGLILENIEKSTIDSTNLSIRDLREVLDLVGGYAEPETRRQSAMYAALRDAWLDIMRDNRWQIYNIELMVAALRWMVMAGAGNRFAMANLAQLKCMTHRGKPIYSINVLR